MRTTLVAVATLAATLVGEARGQNATISIRTVTREGGEPQGGLGGEHRVDVRRGRTPGMYGNNRGSMQGRLPRIASRHRHR